MGNCFGLKQPQTQYFWSYAARGFCWYYGGVLWRFEVRHAHRHHELSNVWVSQHGDVYEDGPNPWRELRSKWTAQQFGRRVALTYLAERIPDADVAHVAGF